MGWTIFGLVFVGLGVMLGATLIVWHTVVSAVEEWENEESFHDKR
jgi:hypothetical protein